MTIASGVGKMSVAHRLLCLGLALLCLSTTSTAVKCFDCVGEDCVGQFCHGDYCMVARYAPRWGTHEWGEPQIIKGCMSGEMVRRDVREHCEASIEEGIDVFTCFCKTEYCNGAERVRKLKIEPVELYTCVCKGEHCNKGSTCIGELCSFVLNHKSKATEQGCINASIPLIERRTAGACMMPPITGAMHHSIAKEAEDLLDTESCTCTGNYCNSRKPEITVKESMRCDTSVKANLMGAEMSSRTIKCSGEFCFKVNITSELGVLRNYRTIGCVSFVDDAELAEELNPIGCAKFHSEKVTVESCFMTKDDEAIARAKENTQQKQKLVTAPPETRKHTVEKPYEFEPAPPMETQEEKEKEEEEEEEEEEEREGKKPHHSRQQEKSEKEEGHKKPVETYIFQGPTEAPIPEDSNTTLVAVFVVIMIIIVIAGVIWKFELHKKVFRASYDTVAGG